MENLSADSSLKGVSFALFGCGNREWARTYQRIPHLVDDLLVAHGAERLVERGEADAASFTFFQDFDEYEVKLWDTLKKVSKSSFIGRIPWLNSSSQRFGVSASAESAESSFSVQIVDKGTARANVLRQTDAALGEVIENRLLTKPGAPMKRHIGELQIGFCFLSSDH